MKPAVGACILGLGVVMAQPVSFTPASWCAAPRSNEPLLRDVKRLLESNEPEPVRHRTEYRLSRRSAVTVVRDEAACRRASQAYWSVLRRSVPGLFGKHADTPVLTVRVGSVYFVDDQRTRDGDAYWEVMIFDAEWQRLSGYGAGADNPETRPDTALHQTAALGRERPQVSDTSSGRYD